MTASCKQPIADATLVDYWADDLAEAELDAVDEHLLGCSACSASSARIAALAGALRLQVPMIMREADIEKLSARGMRIVQNSFNPGERREVEFPAGVDVLLHRLAGLDLQNATRVSFKMSVESTHAVLGELSDAPFDRGSGALLVACRPHYAIFPPDTVADLRVHLEDGSSRDYRYTILHLFADAAGS
jgi:hypothetical protein